MQAIKEYSGVKVTVNEEDLNKKGVIYLLEFPSPIDKSKKILYNVYIGWLIHSSGRSERGTDWREPWGGKTR